ncbi:protein GL2-INTERACTING REPRESSOR 1-like [Malania oleifera]|uniref:protein GL2-INTERACTING REPRESSOR 1-like n=1 Tax=Malania oleifera TaxID=397392 RepID=UPI0025AE469E|nr:protein GL2-INTERACTING REPRESSOR 1-like [Malania oleifera]
MALDVHNKHPTELATPAGGAISPGDNDRGGIASGLRRPVPVTLDLFHTKPTTSPVQLEHCASLLPLDFQSFLTIKTGEIYRSKMSRQNGSSSCNPKLDLKLNLSPPRGSNRQVESPNRSRTVSPTSPPSSCVSSELNQEEVERFADSPEATSSMVLVGCPRCLMYVMLSQDEPKCPKCKSTVLVDFVHEQSITKKTRKN